MLEKYPKEVKLTHKFLAAHDFTWKAAAAALAADRQGKFWQYHDQLFANQLALNDAKLEEIATGLRLDLKRFHDDMADYEIREMIENDLTDAKELGIPTTPWVHINGRRLEDRTMAGFVKAIDQELKR